MGTSHSKDNHSLVVQIWSLCIVHEIWITVAHIPGKQNLVANCESRKGNKDTEWALNQELYAQGAHILNVTPVIDLFASRLNYKCKPHISFKPDREAYAINAFHISWKNFTFYAFPPFCIIQRCLQKISEENATGIMVVPHWPTQPWWPCLINMLTNFPIELPRQQYTLTLPSNPQMIHPLQKTLQLLMCHLSGDCSKIKLFQMQLLQSSSMHGNLAHRNNMGTTYNTGNSTVLNRISVPFLQL